MRLSILPFVAVLAGCSLLNSPDDIRVGASAGSGGASTSSSDAGSGGAGPQSASSGSGGAGGSEVASTGAAGGQGGGGAGGQGGGSGPVEPALVEHTYTESADAVLNPERGFYGSIELIGGGTYGSIRTAGMTLAAATVRLDAFRNAPISDSTLTKLNEGLDKVRARSLKVILRFQYNDGPMGAPDASVERISAHLDQLAPVLAKHADVIALMQAGFIGAWGDWDGSGSGLDNDEARKTVLMRILDALPSSRAVAVRSPNFVDAIFPAGPITEAQAFSGSARSRVGHHNGCFLGSDDDEGTYDDPVEAWKDYISQDSRFTPNGGETCAVNPPRSQCESAKAELERLHFAYLNSEYREEVLQSWEEGGCLDEVRQRLGYRLVLERLEHSGEVAPGGVLRLKWQVKNKGYGSIYNERPLRVVLTKGTVTRSATLTSVDVRRWQPGVNEVDVRLRLPAELEPGEYTIALAMPDAAKSLETNALYAVQLANTEVWDATTGVNVVSKALSVSASAPGDVDPTATSFVELP